MKATHTLYLLFISLLCVAGFTACDDSGSDDIIWDFAPIELHIVIIKEPVITSSTTSDQ